MNDTDGLVPRFLLLVFVTSLLCCLTVSYAWGETCTIVVGQCSVCPEGCDFAEGGLCITVP